MSKTYLVGGAVRDELLGLPVRDRDWVVVGATPEEMLAKGFRQVGADFPVFLHPETNEEYALARTERGEFTTFSPDVTLEEDLQRRDLTINAMARDVETGELIDPFGGQADLEDRVLMRVCRTSFGEDPLRVFRVARFSATYDELGFSVAPETIGAMKRLTAAGKLADIAPERIWAETAKALTAKTPSCYFLCLRQVGALAVTFPEIDALFGVPQPEEHHPEIDTGRHTMLVLNNVSAMTTDTRTRFAALCHDLGKSLTDWQAPPHHHYGHEQLGLKQIAKMGARLRIPTAYLSLAKTAAAQHTLAHTVSKLKSERVLKLLEAVDAIRRPERLEQFLLICEADARGRRYFDNHEYPQADFLRVAAHEARLVTARLIMQETGTLKGPQLGEALKKRRTRAIEIAKHLVYRSPIRANHLRLAGAARD